MRVFPSTVCALRCGAVIEPPRRAAGRRDGDKPQKLLSEHRAQFSGPERLRHGCGEVIADKRIPFDLDDLLQSRRLPDYLPIEPEDFPSKMVHKEITVLARRIVSVVLIEEEHRVLATDAVRPEDGILLSILDVELNHDGTGKFVGEVVATEIVKANRLNHIDLARISSRLPRVPKTRSSRWDPTCPSVKVRKGTTWSDVEAITRFKVVKQEPLRAAFSTSLL